MSSFISSTPPHYHLLQSTSVQSTVHRAPHRRAAQRIVSLFILLLSLQVAVMQHLIARDSNQGSLHFAKYPPQKHVYTIHDFWLTSIIILIIMDCQVSPEKDWDLQQQGRICLKNSSEGSRNNFTPSEMAIMMSELWHHEKIEPGFNGNRSRRPWRCYFSMDFIQIPWYNLYVCLKIKISPRFVGSF